MRVPDITLPPIIASIAGKLPATPPTLALVTALNQLVKKGVLPAEMELLAGKRFEVDVLDAGIKLRFAADEARF
ncbi:Sterol-binding domain protein, partial [Aquitalea sp. S1-19]|nr:Sterol-binding domain protein [Aquitalea sp. S1-19]